MSYTQTLPLLSLHPGGQLTRYMLPGSPLKTFSMRVVVHLAPKIGGNGNFPKGGGPKGLVSVFWLLPLGSPAPRHFNIKSYSWEQSAGLRTLAHYFNFNSSPWQLISFMAILPSPQKFFPL